jgi:nucleotide-binding universal stress UspA family protein
MKILLAVDGSECSDAAVAEVARRPWPPGSEVRVISVAEWPTAPALQDNLPPHLKEDLEKSALKHADGVADSAIATLRENESQVLPISKAVTIDSPRDAIIEEAERWGAELVVVGSQGYRGYKRFLLGSVSQAVAAQAKCSVEIVRHPTLE